MIQHLQGSQEGRDEEVASRTAPSRVALRWLGLVQERLGVDGDLDVLGCADDHLPLLLRGIARTDREWVRVFDRRPVDADDPWSPSGTHEVVRARPRRVLRLPFTAARAEDGARIVLVPLAEASPTEVHGLVRLAAGRTGPEGVLVLDGVFDAGDPETTEEVLDALGGAVSHDLVPVALLHRTLVLCRRGHHARYLDALFRTRVPDSPPGSYRARFGRLRGVDLVTFSEGDAPGRGGPDRGVGTQPPTFADPGSGAPVVLHMTRAESRNPYFTRLPQALERRGWPIHFTPGPSEAMKTLESVHGAAAVAHFHQLEPFYDHEDPGEAGRRAEALLAFVEELRDRRVGIVHTLHNRRRHDRRNEELDALLTQAMCQLADRVVVLGERARDFAAGLAAPERVAVVRHPNYQGTYGPPVPQSVARRALALPEDDFLFLMLGTVKPYKGHDAVLDAFARAALKTARLAIVGAAAEVEYRDHLETRVDRFSGRVRLVAKEVEDAALPLWLGAADAAVVAFEDILMSGSVMLALSYGIPVIAPDIGCLPEYVLEGRNGWLYPLGDVDALSGLLGGVAASGVMSPGPVIETVSGLDVEVVADELASVYRDAAACADAS